MSSTSALPIFENAAREIAQALSDDPTPIAQDYVRRAQLLLQEFQSWPSNPPETPSRMDALAQILNLHREVQEYRAKKRSTPPT